MACAQKQKATNTYGARAEVFKEMIKGDIKETVEESIKATIDKTISENVKKICEVEEFPAFVPTRKLSTKIPKSKSLTEAEMAVGAVTDTEDFPAAIERLKTEDPPLSLEQVRERRESNKELRRDSIRLIRSRTASRISNNSRKSSERSSSDGSSMNCLPSDVSESVSRAA